VSLIYLANSAGEFFSPKHTTVHSTVRGWRPMTDLEYEEALREDLGEDIMVVPNKARERGGPQSHQWIVAF
jgi:hypothetical protein